MPHAAIDRRHFERIRSSYYLRVYDNETGKLRGSVCDVSKGGMRIVSTDPFQKGKNYTFRIMLPDESILGADVTIAVKNRWAKKNDEEEVYEGGFEFSKKIETGIHSIRALVRDLKAKSDK